MEYLRNQSDFVRRTLNCPTDIKYYAINDINLYRYCVLWHLMCLFQHLQIFSLFSSRKCQLQHELVMFEIYMHACMKQMIYLAWSLNFNALVFYGRQPVVSTKTHIVVIITGKELIDTKKNCIMLSFINTVLILTPNESFIEDSWKVNS